MREAYIATEETLGRIAGAVRAVSKAVLSSIQKQRIDMPPEFVARLTTSANSTGRLEETDVELFKEISEKISVMPWPADLANEIVPSVACLLGYACASHVSLGIMMRDRSVASDA